MLVDASGAGRAGTLSPARAAASAAQSRGRSGAIAAARPELPQVACFDTAFHRTMPPSPPLRPCRAELHDDGRQALWLPWPVLRIYRRRAAGALRPGSRRGRVVVAHLGNGASLCAMRDGRSIDTTMGFTALDGLVMGTRCGASIPA